MFNFAAASFTKVSQKIYEQQITAEYLNSSERASQRYSWFPLRILQYRSRLINIQDIGQRHKGLLSFAEEQRSQRYERTASQPVGALLP